MNTRMSLQLPTDELASLSNGALMRLLEEAEENERFLSEERRSLHERLDTGEPETGQASESDSSSVAALERAERALSEQRLELHQRITELRIERGRRVSGLRAHLRVVD